MPEQPQHRADGCDGFWGCGSVFGLLLLVPFAGVFAATRPKPIRHPGVQAIVGRSSYVGARTFDVAIRAPRSDSGADPTVVMIERPKPYGTKGSAGIRLDCDVYWAKEFLSLVFSHSVWGSDASISNTDIQLTDSEGHRFTLLPGVERDYGLIFAIPDNEAIDKIRFNDANYYLSLKASFDLGGPRVIDAPRLDPVVDTVTLVGDTPGYAIAMLLAFGTLYLSPFVSLILIGHAVLRWRRSRGTQG